MLTISQFPGTPFASLACVEEVRMDTIQHHRALLGFVANVHKWKARTLYSGSKKRQTANG